MSPVVECISQWKWNWFDQEHPITDFDVFDKASRGVFGSVLLLRLLKGRQLAVVGAVISIVGIVTTPVTQLLIEYPSRLVSLPPGPDTPNATIPAVQNYRSRVGLAGPRSLDITSFVSAGLVHPSGSLISEVVPVCPSGTCEFPEFESLSLCSKVANITDRIRVGQVPFSTSRDWTTWDNTIDKNPLLLNGTLAYNVSFLDEEDEYFVAPVSFTLYSSRLVRSIAFAEDKTLAAAWVAGYKVVWSNAGNVTYTHGNSTSSNPWNWQAFEMVYYACVNRYSVRVDNGTARTVTLSSHDVVGPSDHGVIAINCTTPRLVSGGAQKTQCQQDGRNPNQGVLTLKGSLPTAQGSNFTADVRSLTLLGQAITHDSAGIWAWDGGAVKILVGNVATPTLADAVYGYRTDDFGTVENRLQTWDTEIQRQRLQNVATNLAVSITNG
ncbi:uncharacterized protein PODANS_4_3660 [Podospora anserina S mat+]|uniref:Podospora anserina S mat+ genomic DNA chromosome 4, supercontig 4 n=1 Tax=Podospora anserina (strain S / ATCC MYA-4624 / DSM 980 / FGSC 10383) TaxID=515849 RepID=B2AQN1_PODAN|nr:uncharacterized protein PODANS_4_3660 [Podospora anserina S mat+]CAP66458.1 unnamed protein product [Podospora anserina S mat+]CDP28186.1 Putative protein of unknown function [Podospora anserina S mat+]